MGVDIALGILTSIAMVLGFVAKFRENQDFRRMELELGKAKSLISQLNSLLGTAVGSSDVTDGRPKS